MKLFAIVVIYNALALLVMCDNLEFLDSNESSEIGETNQKKWNFDRCSTEKSIT
jgi:hypothetical protein